MSEQIGTGNNEQTTVPTRTVQEVLSMTRPGRQALNELAGPLFVSMWTDFLNMVFEWFPHTIGDKSSNERAFQAIRHRVLRVGNTKKREMTMILEDFAIEQLRLTKFERHVLPAKGPFSLPENVKMRSKATN
jgi:hypothetical protein